jgi:hypothetical protein
MIKSFGLDDAMMCFTLLLYTGYLICQALAVTHGVGRHREDIDDKDLPLGFGAWLGASIFCES